jgi:hypothetical protein
MESISHLSKHTDIYKMISVAGSKTKTSICYRLIPAKSIKIKLYSIQGTPSKILNEQYVDIGDYKEISIDNLQKRVYFIVLDYL